MHEIQIYILTSLLKNNSSTFTSMKPPDIENDQYNYHLKYLISQEFIVKNNRNYQLTMKGKSLFPISMYLEKCNNFSKCL